MTIFVAVIIVLALGIVSLVKMTPDLLPSIDLPYVVVMTTYPGATPEEGEQTVSKPLEQNLATVENLKSLQSISNANYSLVVLEFENGADMNTAIVNTMQGVDLVEGSWDEEIGSPYIMKINPNMMPIAIARPAMNSPKPHPPDPELRSAIKPAIEENAETAIAAITMPAARRDPSQI